MALRVQSGLLDDLHRYGAFDIKACFNCGNCTAVCPLSEGDDAFPRRMIRYAQLGQIDHIAASKELWLCYYCGECSETCPREARPGEFVAAARRLSIARFDPFGLASRLFTSTGFAVTGLVGLFVLLLGFLLSLSNALPSSRVDTATLLRFVPYEVIHWTGLGVIVALVVMAGVTMVNMLWLLSREPVAAGAAVPPATPRRFPIGAALWALKDMVYEVFGHRRYRDCDSEKPAEAGAWPVRRWFVHICIMLGFFGLAAATVLDYLFKTPGSYVPVWYPIRLLGTIAGAALIYGVSVAIVQRLRKPERAYYERTVAADWVLLILLGVIGLTGFVLELAEYVTLAGLWVDVVFLTHVAVAMELLLLLPFSKLAHVVYRPVALWFYAFRNRRMGVILPKGEKAA
jgi:ferredoxin